MVTDLPRAARVSKPSTNSDMMRKTRQLSAASAMGVTWFFFAIQNSVYASCRVENVALGHCSQASRLNNCGGAQRVAIAKRVRASRVRGSTRRIMKIATCLIILCLASILARAEDAKQAHVILITIDGFPGYLLNEPQV